MTNKLVVIINSLKVPKIKKILLYEMKFLVPNYSCLQNPWIGGYVPRSPFSLSSVLNWICWTTPPRKKFLGTPLAKVLDFVKADYSTLFIIVAKSKDEYSRIIQYRRTEDDIWHSRRSSTVVLLHSDWHISLAHNYARPCYIWTFLGVGSGRSISGWLSKIALWLGPNYFIFNSGMLPYMVTLSALSHLVMKLLTRKLMQFLPLSNDHYHTYLTTVWLISWTLEVKTKLLSKQKHYNAHNINTSIQL